MTDFTAALLAHPLTALALVLLAVAALAPLAAAMVWQASGRGRRDSAMAIHRQQLRELERDLADGRIAAAEHATAVLEVQRRLLAAAETADPATTRAARWPLVAAIVLVLVLAGGLYRISGRPDLPAMPLAGRLEQAQQQAAQGEALIERLREKLAKLDQNSDLARQGYILLGNAENDRGNLAGAADAWHKAVNIRFDADLAALTAEAQCRVDGKVSFDSATLFRKALASGAPNADWRPVAEQRLKEAGAP